MRGVGEGMVGDEGGETIEMKMQVNGVSKIDPLIWFHEHLLS